MKTLRIAIEYISHLQKTLANDEKLSPLGNTVGLGLCHEQSSTQRNRDTEFRPEFDDDDDDDEDYDDLDDDNVNEDDDISTTTSTQSAFTTWPKHR